MPGERLVPLMMKVVADGSPRTVQVGQAFITDTQVVLSLEPLSLTLDPVAAAEAADNDTRPSAPAPTRARPGDRAADLEWLAQRSRGVLADPRKRRWHGDVRAQLAEIEAELSRLKERSPG